jgi:hypothetical protein
MDVDKSKNAKNDREDYLTKPEQHNFEKYHEVIKAKVEDFDDASTEKEGDKSDDDPDEKDSIGMTASFDVTRSFARKYKAVYRTDGSIVAQTTKNAKTMVMSLGDLEKPVSEKELCRIVAQKERFKVHGHDPKLKQFFDKNASMTATGRACSVGQTGAIMMPLLQALAKSNIMKASFEEEDQQFQMWMSSNERPHSPMDTSDLEDEVEVKDETPAKVASSSSGGRVAGIIRVGSSQSLEGSVESAPIGHSPPKKLKPADGDDD